MTKVITRDVPLYLDEIGTCTSLESVQVQAQVSGQIMSRDFQDDADVTSTLPGHRSLSRPSFTSGWNGFRNMCSTGSRFCAAPTTIPEAVPLVCLVVTGRCSLGRRARK